MDNITFVNKDETDEKISVIMRQTDYDEKTANEKREQKKESDKKRSQRIDRTEKYKIWRKNNPNYFKEYYKQNREIRLEANKRFWKRHPERYKNWKIYTSARRLGKLLNPGQCTLCGTKEVKIQAHHFDYSKPLEVTWLCKSCHIEIHRRKKFTGSS
jgi:hypothetical protein